MKLHNMMTLDLHILNAITKNLMDGGLEANFCITCSTIYALSNTMLVCDTKKSKLEFMHIKLVLDNT